jgi:ethylene receptor
LGGVQVVNLVKPITSLKKLQVLLNLSPEIPEFVVGDEKRLMQTALNVVGNAVKFTKEGSISIKVCLERPDYPMDPLMLEFHPVQGEHHRYIRVEVRDTGVGLNPQDIPKLFNKFLQADSTTTRNYGGTGLGLAICKRFWEGDACHVYCEAWPAREDK